MRVFDALKIVWDLRHTWAGEATAYITHETKIETR
jgi:hypothetical protein